MLCNMQGRLVGQLLNIVVKSETRVGVSKSPNDIAQVRLMLACECNSAAVAANMERQPRDLERAVNGCEGT